MKALSRSTTSVLAVTAVAVTLAIMACHSGVSSTVAPQDAAAKGPTLVVVSDRPAEFEPRKVKIKTGQSVRWENTGGIAHSVEFMGDSATPGTSPNGAVLQPGESYTRVFTSPGTYNYVCRFHIITGMIGKVVVAPNPTASTAGAPPQ
ncbi:MAG TPA: plastocyanin/azurin family copper-binding protein [Candidatus Binataceae bacterium]|nr:plastocyanin/azurin family copper-binding protein [Candidatus Binataceae bacterium]